METKGSKKGREIESHYLPQPPICPYVEAGNEGMGKVVSQRRGLGSGGQMSQRSGWPAASIWGAAEQKLPQAYKHDKQDAGPSHKHQSKAPLSTSP